MLEIRATPEFEVWAGGLRDDQARARIAARLQRAALGNLGDVKPVGGGVAELRIDYGPGYRLYIVRRGASVVVLLCGGDKATQRRDIARAKALAEALED